MATVGLAVSEDLRPLVGVRLHQILPHPLEARASAQEALSNILDVGGRLALSPSSRSRRHPQERLLSPCLKRVSFASAKIDVCSLRGTFDALLEPPLTKP